uniref:Uncharacterized protein n=1 Tax=Nelumbo nucifera TaxID=4432 RepID=A0A822Z6E9_NELNU|nr:TPA_asm: hypothetical protein HUJ06_014955 [Nelumbo nucifera]
MLPPGNQTQRPSLLLVLRILPLSLPPLAPNLLHNPPPSETDILSAIQPVNYDMHVVPMARILTIVPGDRHPIDDSDLLGRLWVPILDGNWVAERLLPIRHQLPDCVAELQPGVPHRGALAAFHERRLQRNWSLGVQFRPQRCHPSLLLELLCEGAPPKEKDCGCSG